MSHTTPNYARISSLAHWTTFFHHTKGLFRLPSPEGEAIHHLDIDLRYVGDKDIPKHARHLHSDRDLFLPNVVTLTLRGGEYVQDDDVRMDCLAEVLLAIKPVEVRWLNATDDPTEQLTFATHLVHPAIIAAGEYWSHVGSLRKLVIQGGFPVPNLTAPTPFALTPAATPCPSPGPARISFGFSRPGSPAPHSHSHPHTPFSGLPALSTTKPKPVDEERVRAREERRRLADYSLKPRFVYAFGGWEVEELHWRLDGRYTPACILSILTHFLKALDLSFPSSSRKADIPLPSLLAFTSLPTSLLPQLASLAAELELDDDLREYLADVGFGATQARNAAPFARVFGKDGKGEVEVGREREVKRTKAEMLLLQANGATVVFTEDLSKVGSGPTTTTAAAAATAGDTLTLPPTATTAISPAGSIASLTHTDGDTATETEDESEAVTPEDGGSPVVQALEQVAQGDVKGKDVRVEGERSLGSSMVL